MKLPSPRRLLLILGAACAPFIVGTRAAEASANPGQTPVYFGTYTGAKSKGIYMSRLDVATGKLSPAELVGEVASPSFLAVHPNRQLLYAVNEVANFQGKKSGAVTGFKIDQDSGKLTLINQQPSGGDGPCHVNVDSTGRAVLVANYSGGSCVVLPIEPGGRLGAATAFIQHRGSSANPSRQEAPHAHGIYLDARNRFAFVPDLGMDKVMIYKFDATQGSLTPNDPAFAALAPGSGPRHLAFLPNGKFAYVISEMLCTITTFGYDADRGKLDQVQTVSTLPAGQTVLPSYSTAEIEAHPTGRFIYGSNRGHHSIAVFTADLTSGKLTLVQNQDTQGKTPRGFGIDPSGHYLLAGNQDSDTVVSFRIDSSTGKLSPTGYSVAVGSPVCVKFLTGNK